MAAARARWDSPTLVLDRRPRDHAELLSFVAHYGALVCRGNPRCALEDVVFRAVRASRMDPSLARMLPVFLWRMRDKLDLDRLVTKSLGRPWSASLGYFLELAGTLGTFDGFGGAVARLRADLRPGRREYFFRNARRNPFEAMVADERTPPQAVGWGLLTGMPTEAFESYFTKVAHL